jgi:hypothetical protein
VRDIGLLACGTRLQGAGARLRASHGSAAWTPARTGGSAACGRLAHGLRRAGAARCRALVCAQASKQREERGPVRERESGRERVEERGRAGRRRLGILPRARARRVRVRGMGPGGPAGLGVVFGFFFQFRNSFLKNSKSHKKLPKIFINGVLDFRLIIIIFLNYCLITRISF